MLPSSWINRETGLCLSGVLVFLLMAVTPGFAALKELDSDNPRALAAYEKGLRLAEEENFNEALEEFRRAIAADSNFIQAHLRYMDALRSVGREGEAAEKYRSKSRQNPGSALYHFLYGRAMDNDLSAKRAEFKAALKADSSFYWAQFGIGGAYMVEKRYDEALVALNKALELNPKMTDAMRLMGTVYLEKGMPYQARRQFQAAVQLEPDDPGLFLKLGQTNSQLERYETAEKYFRRAAQLKPDEPLVYYYIGLVCELGNRAERSVEAYRKFIEMAPQHELAPAATKGIEKLSRKK